MLKNKIEKLIALIENTDIEEIEVSSFWGAQNIRLSKSKNNQNIVSSNINQDNYNQEINLEQVSKKSENSDTAVEEVPDLHKPEEQAPEENNYEDETKFKIITAPLVGTFYSSPKPEDPAFINIGDKVEIGKTVCIIEAMKIFNDIESEFAGELVHIYIENGTPVEYGQELFVLKIDNV